MSYKSTVDNEFESLRGTYLKKMHKNMKNRFKKVETDLFDDFSKVFEADVVKGSMDTDCSEAVDHLSSFCL